jgi:hypothetical protein
MATSFSAREMFLHGWQFELTLYVLNERAQLEIDKRTDNLATVPLKSMVVNSAFALEIYLKCLHFLDHSTLIRREHRLRKIFAALLPGTQQQIRDEYAILMKADSQRVVIDIWKRAKGWDMTDFDFVLVEASSAFEEWRYAYEPEFKRSDHFWLG